MKKDRGDYRLAIKLAQYGYLLSAQKEFERYLASHPHEYARINYNLASHFYRSVGSGSIARSLFERVLEKQPPVFDPFVMIERKKAEGFARVGLMELSLSYEEFFERWDALSKDNQNLAKATASMHEFTVKAQAGGYTWWQVMDYYAMSYSDPTGKRPEATQYARGLAFQQLMLLKRKGLRIPRTEWRRIVIMCVSSAKAVYNQNLELLNRPSGMADEREIAIIGDIATPLLEEFIAENPDEKELARVELGSLPWRKTPPSPSTPPAPAVLILDSQAISEAQSLGNQALSLKERGDLNGALALFKKQETLYRQSGNQDGVQTSLAGQANILYVRGELDGAQTLYKEMEQICRQLGNQVGLAGSLGGQALILRARGRLSEALALHKEEERIFRQLGDQDGLQTSLGNQANILADNGNEDTALTLLKEQERISRQIGSQDGLRRSLGNQGVILFSRRDLHGALRLHKEEEQICRKMNNLNGLAECLGNQANVLAPLGDVKGALELHKEEERLCRQAGNQRLLATSLANQAFILSYLGNRSEGLRLAQQALNLANEYGYSTLVGQIQQIIRTIQG